MKTKVIIEENGKKKFIFEIEGQVEVTKSISTCKVKIEFKEDRPLLKDGDVIYVKINDDMEYISIFKDIDGTMLRTYCDKLLPNGTVWTLDASDCFLSHIDQIKEMRIATEEQKKILFDGLTSVGKRWNAQEKRLEDIPKVGDSCIFWDYDKQTASVNILAFIKGSRFYIRESCFYINCVKFVSEEQYRKIKSAK